VSLVREGERREGRGEPVILGILVHHAQAPLEIVRHFEQERERAAVARIRPLVTDAGAGYVRERQCNDVADGAALRRVGESARQIAGVMVAERDHAQRKQIGAEHDVADDAGARVRAAAARGSPCLQHVADRVLGEVGLLRHQTHVAAEGALAVERTLRSLEHLDVVDVEHARIHGAGHRGVVDVETGCARRTEQILSSNAANRDRAGIRDAGGTSAVGKGDVRRLGCIVVERLNVVILEILRRERRDAHRHLRQGLVALSRRHDDGIERRRLRSRRRRILRADGAPVKRSTTRRRKTQKLSEEASTRHRLISRDGRRIGGLMVRVRGLGFLSAPAPCGRRLGLHSRRGRLGLGADDGDGVRIHELVAQTRVHEQPLQSFGRRQRPLDLRALETRHELRGEHHLEPRLLRQVIERIGQRLCGDAQVLDARGRRALRRRARPQHGSAHREERWCSSRHESPSHRGTLAGDPHATAL
jgi:hypothetical protein